MSVDIYIHVYRTNGVMYLRTCGTMCGVSIYIRTQIRLELWGVVFFVRVGCWYVVMHASLWSGKFVLYV